MAVAVDDGAKPGPGAEPDATGAATGAPGGHHAAKRVLAPPPPRAERIAAVRALTGTPDPSVRHLALGIRGITRRSFDRYVLPLVDEHWPAVRDEPFFVKLRIGACDMYASGPYTVLFCAPNQPALVRVVTEAGNLLPLPYPALALFGRGAIGLFGRFMLPEKHRRIVLIAAFIMVVDHVIDHCMTDPPEVRGPRLEAIIDGREQGTTPELRLTRALAVAMAEGLEGEELAAFEAAMVRLKEWIRAEVRAMRGEPDPLGLGHRLPGIEGGIDGLLFPVVRYTGEGARRWMYDVAFFMQVLDDWFDYEQDTMVGRSTPVTTGDWAFSDIETMWRKTVSGLEALVRAAGLGSPRYVRFVREAYVLMMLEVIDAMAQRPDL